MSNYWNRLIVTFFVALGVVTFSFAQPKLNSPYSRIGLGDINIQNFASLSGMAGISAAYHDPFNMNILNPASYSYLEATSFELGLDIRRSYLSSQGATAGIWSGNLSYFSLGFPLKNPINREANPVKSNTWWAMNFSLLPYSNVGYNIQTTEDDPEIGQILYDFQGSGGTFKVHWGNSFRYKNFSVGLNLGYLFGKISNDREVNFPDVEVGYIDLLNDEFSVGGFVWNIGFQYDIVFEKMGDDGKLKPDGRKLTFGLYGNTANNIGINTSQFYRRLSPGYSSSNTVVRDTIRAFNDIEVSGKLPSEIAFGVSYSKDFKWRYGIDFTFAGWGSYVNEAKPENLSNTWRIAVGGEFTPNARSYNRYFEKVAYRYGLFYGKDPRGLDINLVNYGVTFGMGMPIILKNQTSFVNWSVEIGQLGASNALRETYVNFTLGFTLNNRNWFLKRKFY
ncbi:MAG: hypothetical protein AAF985_04700 [Bacteroidota bacterium]